MYYLDKKYIIKNKRCQFLGQALTTRPFFPAGLWTTRLVPDSPLWLLVVCDASSCLTPAGGPGGGCSLQWGPRRWVLTPAGAQGVGAPFFPPHRAL